MANIYNYLKIAFQELKSEAKQNHSFLLLLFVLFSIPMGYAISGIAVGLFMLITMLTFKKANTRIEKKLIFLIVLYFLMVLSITWSHDVKATAKAISKTLPLLVIPVCFMISSPFSGNQKQKILKYYSLGMLLFVVYYILKATVRFAITKDTSVFFYHELVTEDVNAIHVSVYVSVSAFYFMTQLYKSTLDKIAFAVLTLFLVLLSSKNILIIFFVLVIANSFLNYKLYQKNKLLKIGAFFLLLIAISFAGKIKDRFMIELQSNATENRESSNYKTHNVSIYKAWTQETFNPNDYFSGTAFRVYQIRIFKEMLQEDPMFLTGYGLNASDFRIEEKGKEHNVFLGDATHDGYQKKNFHNQYIQIFSETGIFGLLLLFVLVFLNLKNAIKTKDFVHISFAVLMISLFLTESFLSRQRGVVFFTAMYCLFNTGITHEKLEKST